eukprot:scaffold5943_cov113-Isochrysis_galbana.AAC.2
MQRVEPAQPVCIAFGSGVVVGDRVDVGTQQRAVPRQSYATVHVAEEREKIDSRRSTDHDISEKGG